MTEPARLALKRVPYDLICRHAINDYGLVTPAERAENDTSMKTIGKIISRYRVSPVDPKAGCVTITTDDEWNNTVVALEKRR